MFKILKYLKPYIGFILLITIMVVGIGLSALLLPHRMSKIIGEGIKAEVINEKTEDGQTIFIKIEEINMEMPLPKIKYNNAGKLVTEEENGKHYAIIIGTEKDDEGNDISVINPQTGEPMVIPELLRTVDGEAESERQQGTLDLDDNGNPKIVFEQRSNFAVIFDNGIIMLSIALFSSILSIFVAYLSSMVGTAFGKDIRNNLFTRVLNFSKAQEDSFSTSSLITRTTNDVTQLQMLIIMALRMVINVPVMFIGGLVMALNKNVQMTLVLVVIIPVIALVIGFVAKNIIPIFKSIQKRIDHLTMVARENITGVRVIRAFGGEEHEDNRFEKANKNLTDASLKAAKIMALLMPAMMFIMSVTTVAIVSISAFSINKALQNSVLDYTKLGNTMAVIQYVIQIMFSVIMVSVIFIMVPRASVSANRIDEVLKTESDIVDPKEPKTGKRVGSVEFENVSFAYSNSANKNVLENINFVAKKGTVTSIIGGTGSGKSTLINLIPRQYDVTKGKVKVDNIDVRDMTLRDLRKRIGFVSQNAVLFEGNIKNNILYGTENEKKLEQAIDIAQARGIINEKEGGLEAVVEQGGRNFSGGQKQRISIARALSKDAEIIIMDDSFSALDFATDSLLRKELSKVIKDKTIIVVAQRIGTVMDSDNIIVLDKGRIVGEGKHKDLMRNCEEYRDIALSQLSEEELMPEGGI